MKRGIIFDMDGTLWDSAEGVAKSWTEVIQTEISKEKKVTTEEIKSVMGLSMDKIADILFSDLEKEKRMELLKKCGDHENDYLREHGANLYPDLEDTFKILKADYHLFIVSNCQSGYIEAFLDHYDLWKYFDKILCYGDNNQQKAYNIKKIVDDNKLDEAFYLGDIEADYLASMEAGVKFVHAAYGFGKMEHETAFIHEFKELPEVAKSVFSL